MTPPDQRYFLYCVCGTRISAFRRDRGAQYCSGSCHVSHRAAGYPARCSSGWPAEWMS